MLLDFAMGCGVVGLFVPVFAWPQLNLFVLGLALIVIGVVLYLGLKFWEERTERKK
jgi:hypothetical protein